MVTPLGEISVFIEMGSWSKSFGSNSMGSSFDFDFDLIGQR